MLTDVKIHAYQRNGVHGEDFYAATCYVVISSCRAVQMSNPAEKWRGDDFAWAMHKWIHKKGRKAYDLIVK